MKNIFKKLLSVSAVTFLLTACGEDTTTNTTTAIPGGTPQPSINNVTPLATKNVYNALEDWRKPRLFAKSTSNTICNKAKVFMLRPHATTIQAKFVDFTSQDIYPSGYRIRATQVKNPNIKVDLEYDTITKRWKKECVPVTYVNKNDIYPAYWVEAINDSNGSVVTRDKVIIYDDGTKNCMACHASNSQDALAYANTPANLADPETDFKVNILRIHDKKHNTTLENKSKTAVVSCTSCHGINGVQGSGKKNLPALTNAIHAVHANLKEPNIMGATNCLTCHPGETISKTFNGKVMHELSRFWRSEDGHGEWTEKNGAVSCTLCHGLDLRGTKISNNTSCYKCHGREWNTPIIGVNSLNGQTLADFVNNDDNNNDNDNDNDDDDDDDD